MNSNGYVIEVRGLRKWYFRAERKLTVLDGIDLSLEHGEMVSVIGVSGVGKSTLLHILGTLDLPSAGEIYINGRNPFTLSAPKIAQFRNHMIGFVFQAHHLLPEFSALENVMIPLLIDRVTRREARGRAEQLLQHVGLSDRADHKPGELSGGEQQRVAVARALISNPRIIVADEPTGNLDEATGRTIHNLLRQINEERGITFVIATHNVRLASQTDRQFRLVDGKLQPDALKPE